MTISVDVIFVHLHCKWLHAKVILPNIHIKMYEFIIILFAKCQCSETDFVRSFKWWCRKTNRKTRLTKSMWTRGWCEGCVCVCVCVWRWGRCVMKVRAEARASMEVDTQGNLHRHAYTPPHHPHTPTSPSSVLTTLIRIHHPHSLGIHCFSVFSSKNSKKARRWLIDWLIDWVSEWVSEWVWWVNVRHHSPLPPLPSIDSSLGFHHHHRQNIDDEDADIMQDISATQSTDAGGSCLGIYPQLNQTMGVWRWGWLDDVLEHTHMDSGEVEVSVHAGVSGRMHR